MLAKIGEIVRQVALIVLLAAFLEMLLPEKKMTRYVRLVLGLFVVVAILTPLAEGLRLGPELDVVAWDLRLEPVTVDPVQQGREMATANEEAALEIYRQRLAGQIKALVTLVPGIRAAEVLVSVAGEQGRRGAIRRVVVVASLEEPAQEEEGEATPLMPPKVDRVEVKPPAKPEIDAGMPPEAAILPEKEGETSDQAGLSEPPGLSNQLPPATGGAAVEKEPGTSRGKTTEVEIQEIKARIVTMINHFYGLEPGQVEVQLKV